jgi:hypothetical protein
MSRPERVRGLSIVGWGWIDDETCNRMFFVVVVIFIRHEMAGTTAMQRAQSTRGSARASA